MQEVWKGIIMKKHIKKRQKQKFCKNTYKIITKVMKEVLQEDTYFKILNIVDKELGLK